MDCIPMYEAKSKLSTLVKRAAKGETILISGDDDAEAVLTSVDNVKRKKRIGILAETLCLPDDLEDPLPDEVIQGFYGEDDATSP